MSSKEKGSSLQTNRDNGRVSRSGINIKPKGGSSSRTGVKIKPK